MEDLSCPRCKSTKYRNPSLKLMVNVCGHTLCENCVSLLFFKGSGSCPDCGVPLRRSNFRVQLFDDASVEKEVDIRRRILRDYNKKEEDFETLKEYNDYLEEIETIIYNLNNNLDIINTNKKIEQYKKDNRDIIMRNKNKIKREEYELEEILEVEKHQEEMRRNELQVLEQETKKKKIREKEALIDELMASYEDATKIVNAFAEKAVKTQEEAKIIAPPKPVTQFSTGIKLGRAGAQGFLPIPKQEEGPLYVHVMPKLWLDGPDVPHPKEIETKGYIKHIRNETVPERAGGFKSVIACQRALQEALQGLFHGT